MSRRRLSLFGGAGGPALIAIGVWNFVDSILLWPYGAGATIPVFCGVPFLAGHRQHVPVATVNCHCYGPHRCIRRSESLPVFPPVQGRKIAILAKTLQIPTADGQADAYAACPDDGKRHPGVLLYPDAIGVRPALEEMARELAEHGYYVLVPNIFYRHGPAPVVELPEHIGAEHRSVVFAQLMPLVEAHTTERALRDADAYLTFLTNQPEVSAGPVAVIGYCMGAVLALRTAAAHPDQVAAVAGFHPGALVTDAPDSPHLLVATVTARVHLGLAENDLSAEAISELTQAMEAADIAHTCEIYPGAVHGFTMSDTEAFDPAALQRHWDRLLPLLDHTLAERSPSG